MNYDDTNMDTNHTTWLLSRTRDNCINCYCFRITSSFVISFYLLFLCIQVNRGSWTHEKLHYKIYDLSKSESEIEKETKGNWMTPKDEFKTKKHTAQRTSRNKMK